MTVATPLILALSAALLAGVGVPLIAYPAQVRSFLFEGVSLSDGNTTIPNNGSTSQPETNEPFDNDLNRTLDAWTHLHGQADVGFQLFGVSLLASAVLIVVVWSLAGNANRSNSDAAGRQLLNVVLVFVPSVWIGVLAVVLVSSGKFAESGLYFSIGASATLLLLNAIQLMVNCWPIESNASSMHQPNESTPLIDSASVGNLNVGLGGGSVSANSTATTATQIAKKAADAIAEKEASEKKSRERGYGTWKLLQLARPHRVWLYAGCAVLLIRLPFSLSIPHWVAETIGALIDSDYDRARWNIAYLMICGTFDSILDFWCVYLFGLAQQKIIRSLRVDLFGAILKQEIGFFDTTKIGEITSRLTADTAEMANDLTWVFRFTIEAFVRIGGILAYMMIRSWRLGLMALAIIPVTAVINRFYAQWMHGNQKQVQTALAEANTVAEEVISSIRTVFSFAMEHGEHVRYRENIQTYYILVVKQVFVQGIYFMVCCTFLINTCVQAALLLYGSYLVAHLGLQPQVLLAFMLYQGQLQEYFQNLLNSFTSLIKSSGAAAKVFEYIDRTPRYDDKNPRFEVVPADNQGINSGSVRTKSDKNIYEDAEPLLAPLRVDNFAPMSVAIRNVSFCYPGRPEALVLDGLSLTASPGEVVALVGSSGSGKSTIFHLIEHFYEPQIGHVMIDGQDVTTLNHDWLHQRVALVGQEPTLLSGTIADNIMYGLKEKAHGEQFQLLKSRMIKAATAANAHSFIMDLPNQYETQVGERGVQLSGGQKQRIAIARCLIRDPAVLLLDEATSALDSESEAVVQDALEKAMQNRTTLLIAHRLSTVRNANKILMIHKGRVIESGNHDELMNSSTDVEGVSYRNLVQRQTLQ